MPTKICNKHQLDLMRVCISGQNDTAASWMASNSKKTQVEVAAHALRWMSRTSYACMLHLLLWPGESNKSRDRYPGVATLEGIQAVGT